MHGHHHDFAGRRDPRSMGGGWEGRPGGFGGRWGGRFDMPRSRGFASEEDFFGAMGDIDFEEGDDVMFGNKRDWRGGGPHGRDRQDFGFGFGRGPGRGERPLEQGDLRWIVLDLIAAQPRHGYEIIKAIEEMLNGNYTPSPGVIYPTLTYLEETGLIASEAQSTKKLYSLTDEGKASIETNAAEIQAARGRIAAARERFGAPPAPEMMRAMGNLRGAIQVRLQKGELSSESLAIITAALDKAASEIERS